MNGQVFKGLIGKLVEKQMNTISSQCQAIGVCSERPIRGFIQTLTVLNIGFRFQYQGFRNDTNKQTILK